VLLLFLTLHGTPTATASSGSNGGSNSGNANNANAYKVLGLTPSASQEDIRQQYRKLCLKYHPDKNVNKDSQTRQAYETQFKHIQQAYGSVNEVTKRRQYDDELRSSRYSGGMSRFGAGAGASPFSGRHSSGGGSAAEEMYRAFYEQHMHSSSSSRQRRRPRKRFYVNGVDISHLFPGMFGGGGNDAERKSNNGMASNNPFFFGREPPVSIYVQEVEIPLQDLYTGKAQETFTFASSTTASASTSDAFDTDTSTSMATTQNRKHKRKLFPGHKLLSRYVAAYRGGLLQQLFLQGVASSAILALRRTRMPFALAYMVGYIHMNLPQGPWQHQHPNGSSSSGGADVVYRTKLQAGWKEGTKITFKHHNTAAHQHHEGGYVVTFILKEQPHELYWRVGNNLHTQVTLSNKFLKQQRHKKSSGRRNKGGGYYDVEIPPLDIEHGAPIILHLSQNILLEKREEDIILRGKGWPKKDGSCGDLIVTVKYEKKSSSKKKATIISTPNSKRKKRKMKETTTGKAG
jgi:DnaJ-class molecular chaperone